MSFCSVVVLSAWRNIKPDWQDLHLARIAHAKISLPLRETIPRDRQELSQQERKYKEYLQAFNAAKEAGEPAFKIKQLADLVQHWQCMDRFLDRWAGLSDRELRDRILTVELEAVRINDVVLAGLPGESMSETCRWLRAQSLGDRLIVLDQVNGYCVYQTTRQQYDLGGYAFWCSCLARDAERGTRREALELIRNVCCAERAERRP